MREIKRDIEFLVFEDKGIVVCKLHNCRYNACNRITKYVGKFHGVLFIEAIINDIYTGVARCAPEDTFNLEYGKKLALTRAKAKRCRAINAAIKNYVATEQNKLARLLKEGIHKVPDEKEIKIGE